MFKNHLMITALVGAMFLSVGCTKNDSPDSSVGNVSMAVVMDDGSEVTAVHWTITDASGTQVREGDIDVTDPSAVISTYVMGLPAGTGYVMSLTADLMMDGEDIGDCSQTATFDVTAGEVTSLTMTLNCTLDVTDGDVAINVGANTCPTIDYLTVTPLTQAVGKDIMLSSEVSDKDGDEVTITWSADAGSVTNADAADAIYPCTVAGGINITLSITDGVMADNDEVMCDITKTIPVMCKTSAVCGDGEVGLGEQCDDSNTDDEDGCSSKCRIEYCGDGVIQAGLGETCEMPNVGLCGPNCTVIGCGNGILDPGEECDDDNLDDCDGCSSSCKVEACGNGVKECNELCDDGNDVDDDECSNSCTIPLSACEQCEVDKCMDYKGDDVYTACVEGDTSAACIALMECAHTTGCVTTAADGTAYSSATPSNCYCGSASTMLCMTGAANGSCKAEVEAAAGTTDPMDIGTRFADPDYAVGDAFGLLLCELDNCLGDDLCL